MKESREWRGSQGSARASNGDPSALVGTKVSCPEVTLWISDIRAYLWSDGVARTYVLTGRVCS